MAFQANLPKFEAANCAVVGCSNDPVEKNTEFATKEGFAYPLLCDTDLAGAKAYDSAKPEGDAARRTAALIGEDGTLIKFYDPAGKEEFPPKVLEDLA